MPERNQDRVFIVLRDSVARYCKARWPVHGRNALAGSIAAVVPAS